ncbi:dephospho-CoA kinase [Thalassotalea ganghwensis]
MSKFTIGLTGGIGSGKTAVSDRFKSLGIDIIDADIVAREVVCIGSDALHQIETKFGQTILLDNGELNRAKLRAIVFNDSADKEWLNNLLHPLIRQNILKALKEAKSDYCILVAPLLLENGLQHLVNRVLVIDVSRQCQIARTITRDSSDKAQVEAIINSQISRQDRLSLADDVIDNESISLADIEKIVAQLHQKYLEFSKTGEN